MEEIPQNTIAKYDSFCFKCEQQVHVGEMVILQWFSDPRTGEWKSAWPHLHCHQNNNKSVGFIY